MKIHERSEKGHYYICFWNLVFLNDISFIMHTHDVSALRIEILENVRTTISSICIKQYQFDITFESVAIFCVFDARRKAMVSLKYNFN